MKCGQVECKQNNMGHMPVAKHQHKDTHTHRAPPLPQLDYVLVALSGDVSDVCVCVCACICKCVVYVQCIFR